MKDNSDLYSKYPFMSKKETNVLSVEDIVTKEQGAKGLEEMKRRLGKQKMENAPFTKKKESQLHSQASEVKVEKTLVAKKGITTTIKKDKTKKVAAKKAKTAVLKKAIAKAAVKKTGRPAVKA